MKIGQLSVNEKSMLGRNLAWGGLLACAVALGSVPQVGHTVNQTGGRAPIQRQPPIEEAPPEEPSAAPSGSRTCRGSNRELPDVYLHSGEFHLSVVDLRIPGRGMDFVWKRSYRSRLGRDTAIGQGWDFSYNLRIEASGPDVRLFDGNGRADVYRRQADGSYTAAQFFREGVFEPDRTFTLLFADLGRWKFLPLDASPLSGRIQSISDRNGNTISFAYEAATGKLSTITDTLGRVVAVGWNGSRIASVMDVATGRTVAYSHGSTGDLQSSRSPTVTGTPNGNDFPLGKTTTYTYSTGFSDERLNHNLETITDPRGNTWLANQYGAADGAGELRFDRLLVQRRGIATDTIEIVYLSITPQLIDDPQPPILRAIVNDRVGNVREYFYDGLSRLVAKREFTGRADPNEPTTATSNRPTGKLRSTDPTFFETQYAHDEDSLTTRIVHPNGNVTRSVYELELDPAAPWRTRGNLRELHRLPGSHAPAGDQAAGVVELYEYSSGFGGCCGTSFVSRHTDARGNITEHDYDAFGNRIQTRHRVDGGVEDWTYDVYGRETSHTFPDDGEDPPRRRIDEKHYYGPADGAQNGYLRQSVVDAANLALTTSFVYDAAGNATSVTDPRGNDTQFLYNSLNQVVREKSRPLVSGPPPPYRLEKLFWYDGNDNLVRVDVENRNEIGNPQGNAHFTTIHEFDVLDQVVCTCQERVSVAVAASTLTCSGLPAGAIVTREYGYDANRNRTLVRHGEAVAGDQPANVVQTLYDERDLVWLERRAPGDPAQSTVQRDYDRNGNLAFLREGLEDGEHVTSYQIDSLDRVVLETDPMGNTTEYHYDPNGNLGGRVGNDGSSFHPFATLVTGERVDGPGSAGNMRLREVMHQYDAMDRRIRTDEKHFDTESQQPIPDGQSTTTWTYAPNSLLRSMTTDGGGSGTTYAYDTVNRLRVVEDAEENTQTFTYDPNGNVLSLLESEHSDLGGPFQNFTTTYIYDALDRLRTETDNRGSQTQHAYDSRGNLVLDTDPLGQWTRYVYDGLDRRTETRIDMNGNGVFTDLADIVLLQGWDDSSRKILETDDNNRTTRYAYDALDRRIVTQYADGTIDQVGTGATWVLGQPLPNFSAFVSGYDSHDAVEQRTDANGTRVDATYDGLDRVLQRTIVRAPLVLGTTFESYQYDGLSRIVRAEDDDSLVVRGSPTTSGYDSLSNVLRETQQVSGGTPQTVTAAYDGESNATLLIYPGGRRIAREFDVLNRPRLVRDDPPGAGTTIATYAYVGPSRLAQRNYGNGTRTEFTYDGITGVTNPPGDFGVRQVIRTKHFTFPEGVVLDERTNVWDRAGDKSTAQDLTNPVDTRQYQYDAADRLRNSTSSATGQSSNYVLEGAGNRQSVSGTVDPGTYGINAVNEYTFTPFDSRSYDSNGNLRTITNPNRTLSYDYRNQLVQFVDSSTGQTTTYRYDCFGRRIEKLVGTEATRIYHDGPEEIEEQNASGATTATYVYSQGRHSRLQMAIPATGAKYYFHEDDLGSVRAVTDSTAQLVESVEYGDFGKPTVTSSTTPGSHLQPPTQSGMHDSDQDAGAGSHSILVADNFTLSQPWQLAGLRWRGTYDQSAPATDDFWMEIRVNAGGLPGAPLAGSQRHLGNAVARTATGLLIVGFYTEYSYQAAVSPPISLSPGVPYWLVLYGNSVGYPGTWRWEQGSSGNGQAAQNFNSQGWSVTGGDTAFELQLQSGPPPSGNPFLFMGWRLDSETGFLPAGPAHDPRAGRFLERHLVPDLGFIESLGNPYTFAWNNPSSFPFMNAQDPKSDKPQEQEPEVQGPPPLSYPCKPRSDKIRHAAGQRCISPPQLHRLYVFRPRPCGNVVIKDVEGSSDKTYLDRMASLLEWEPQADREARNSWGDAVQAGCAAKCEKEGGLCEKGQSCKFTGKYTNSKIIYETKEERSFHILEMKMRTAVWRRARSESVECECKCVQE